METRTKNTVFIHALVGSENHALVNQQNVLPTLEHIPGTGTYEKTLIRIGEEIGVTFLSVAERAYELEQKLTPALTYGEHHVIYKVDTLQTKPNPKFESHYGEPVIVPDTTPERHTKEYRRLQKLAQRAEQEALDLIPELHVLL